MGRERLPRDFGRKKRVVSPLVIGAAVLAVAVLIAGWLVWDRRGPSAAVWMDHYCGSALALRSDVDGVNQNLKNQVRNRRPATEIGRSLNEGLDFLIGRTATLRSHMTSVGKPGGSNGDEPQALAIERLDRLMGELQTLKAQSAGMVIGNPWVVEGGSRQAQATMNSMSQFLSAGDTQLAEVEKFPELKRAGDTLPSRSCSQLRAREDLVSPARFTG